MTDDDIFESTIAREIHAYGSLGYSPRDYSTAARDVIDGGGRRPLIVAWLTVAAGAVATVTIGAILITVLFRPGGSHLAAPETLAAQVARLFASTQDCDTKIAGHTISIAYPSSWWAFSGGDGTPPCVWMAPRTVAVPSPLTSRPAGTIITFGAVGGGPAIAGDALATTVNVAGRASVRVEETGASPTAGQRALLYWVPLGPNGDGPTLVATTEEAAGGVDYELNKAILDKVMAELRIE